MQDWKSTTVDHGFHSHLKLVNMKQVLFTGWHFARILRMALALAIAVQGIVQHDFPVILIGFLLAATALFNIGCCGPSGCSVPTRSVKLEEKVEFEEL